MTSRREEGEEKIAKAVIATKIYYRLKAILQVVVNCNITVVNSCKVKAA